MTHYQPPRHELLAPRRLAKTLYLPPGPGLVDVLLAYARDPLGFFVRCSHRYGDVVRLVRPNMPHRPGYLLNHPDHIEYVLVKNNRNFVRDQDSRKLLDLLGNGLLTSEGEFWRRQRRFVQPAFHRARLDTYRAVMESCAQDLISEWQDGEIRDVLQDMTRLTLRIVAKTLFSADMADDTNKVGKAIEMVMDRSSEQGSTLFARFILGRIPTPGTLRYHAAIRRLNEVIASIIAKHRGDDGGEERDDLLSMLIHAKDDQGNRMSDQQLHDEVLTVIMAGHETTAVCLSWTWHLLATHPEVETKLLTELRDVLAGRAPLVADLPQLRYTAAVLKESMRLYPPGWVLGREAVEGCKIGGYDVPAGTQLYMSQWVAHRDPRYFEKPDAFIPERWTDEFEAQLPKYAYFPFSGGPRVCPGKSFAIMETAIVLATIVQRFQLRTAPGEHVAPLPSITLRPKGGLRMILTAREALRHEDEVA